MKKDCVYFVISHVDKYTGYRVAVKHTIKNGKKTYKMVEEQRIVWEKHFGKIPKGMHIHHKNEIKTDNRIENLEMLSAKEHRRKHTKNFIKDGVEVRPCVECKKAKTLDYFYLSKGYPMNICKVCSNARAMYYWRKKKRKYGKYIKNEKITKKCPICKKYFRTSYKKRIYCDKLSGKESCTYKGYREYINKWNRKKRKQIRENNN